MKFEKREIIINSRKASYWEKNHGQKEVVVLLHGFPGNHSGLVDMANGLGKYRLIIPDLPACGDSEPLDEKHNLKNYAKWLNEFFEKISVKQAAIVGHSFGSRVALVFTENYPEKVEKMILIAPVVKVEGLISWAVSLEYKIAEMLPKHLKRIWLANRIHSKVGEMIIFKSASAKRRKELLARDEKERKKFNPKINIELFNEFYKFSLVPIGQKIKKESLVIAGDKDSIAPLNSIKELVSRLTNANLIVMKNSGHIVVLERPIAVAKVINNWLKK